MAPLLTRMRVHDMLGLMIQSHQDTLVSLPPRGHPLLPLRGGQRLLRATRDFLDRCITSDRTPFSRSSAPVPNTSFDDGLGFSSVHLVGRLSSMRLGWVAILDLPRLSQSSITQHSMSQCDLPLRPDSADGYSESARRQRRPRCRPASARRNPCAQRLAPREPVQCKGNSASLPITRLTPRGSVSS
jgi:hypothetical protein